MKDLFKKQWITFLGALFTFMSFSYLFKFAVDKGWISNELKIGIGILAGAGFIVGGIAMQQRGKGIVSQIVNGLGVALLYTTFSFAGIYFNLWSPMTVFLSMVAVTLCLSVYSFKYDFRILMNVAIIGALISPLVMKCQGDQVFTLFLYLLVLNTIFFFVSVVKKWTELRLIPFVGTWLMFTVYYFYFNPDSWNPPALYAISAYIFFVVGFMISSWKENLKFDGLNLYLGILNAVVFALWTFAILGNIVPYSLILGGMGIIYLLVSAIIYMLTRRYSVPVFTKFFGGLLFLLIAGAEIGQGLEAKPIISVFMWALIAAVVLIIGQVKKIDYLKLISAVIWLVIGVYWYATTWSAPLGIWFDVFIPILNWSGMAWVLLAIMGFYFSIKVKFNRPWDKEISLNSDIISTFFSTCSHLIVGGLLTFQIDNLWKYYDLKFIDLDLTLSISWAVYALLIFLWGAYSKQSFFRWFGSAVLIVVTVKTIFIDLSGKETVFKILVLFILGILSFAISFINNKWKGKGEEVFKKEEIKIGSSDE
jgi:uncharacterized membrane protein